MHSLNGKLNLTGRSDRPIRLPSIRSAGRVRANHRPIVKSRRSGATHGASSLSAASASPWSAARDPDRRGREPDDANGNDADDDDQTDRKAARIRMERHDAVAAAGLVAAKTGLAAAESETETLG